MMKMRGMMRVTYSYEAMMYTKIIKPPNKETIQGNKNLKLHATSFLNLSRLVAARCITRS